MCSHERECKSLGLDCSSQVRVVTCDANNENSPSNDNRNEKKTWSILETWWLAVINQNTLGL